MPDVKNFFVKRASRLLKDFDRTVQLIEPVLGKAFPGADTADLIGRTRREYTSIIPQLPDLGGKQPFTQFIISTGMILAVYRIARQNGKTLEETGVLIYDVSSAYLRAYPQFMARFFGRMNFSRLYLWRLRRGALESHRRRYPNGYVFNFIEGDGKTFDYGIDYLECASCKFLAKQGAPELAPYICPADVLYSEAQGWGLLRTTTLAEGAERCDFRFKKGGATKVAVPDALRSRTMRTVARTEDHQS